MGVLAVMDEPPPMKRDGIVVKAHADNQGPRYVLLILVGMFGALMFTAVACEGMMVEYSHRERLFDRGRTTCWCIGTRFLCEGIGSMTTALAFNSNEFGGTFHSAVPLRLIFAGYALLGLVGVVFTKFFIYEEQKPVTSQHLATQCRRIWSILQKRMVSQVTVLGFLINVGFLYKIYEADQIYKAWLHTNQLEANIPVALVGEGKAVAAAFIFFFLLNANWRSILVWSVIVSLVVMVPVDILVVYDISRSLALALAKSAIVAVADGFLTIVYFVVVIEVAEPGYEAVSFGIITLVYNLGFNITTMIKNVMASQWSPEIVNIASDTKAVRKHIMNELLVKYGLRIGTATLVWTLLPKQKRHVCVITAESAPNLVLPVVTFSIFAILFVLSVTSNTLAIFPSTSCLPFAGGNGC